MKKSHLNLIWRVYGIPIAIALLVYAGLLWALVGPESSQIVSWVVLGLPLIVFLRSLF
jgi:hypothetical protein